MFLADQHELANAAQDCYRGKIAPYIRLGASPGEVLDLLCASLALADAIHSAHVHSNPRELYWTTTAGATAAKWTVTQLV